MNAEITATALKLARKVTNTFACVARTNRDHDAIFAFHREIDELERLAASRPAPAPHAWPDCPDCGAEVLAWSDTVDGSSGAHCTGCGREFFAPLAAPAPAVGEAAPAYDFDAESRAVCEAIGSDVGWRTVWCALREAYEAGKLAATPPTGEAERLRDCSCLGSCNGPERLSPRYRCALAPRAPEPAAPVEPLPAANNNDDSTSNGNQWHRHPEPADARRKAQE